MKITKDLLKKIISEELEEASRMPDVTTVRAPYGDPQEEPSRDAGESMEETKAKYKQIFNRFFIELKSNGEESALEYLRFQIGE